MQERQIHKEFGGLKFDENKKIRKKANSSLLFILMLTLVFFAGCAKESNENAQSGSEVTGETASVSAVVYYSQTGNTKAIAERLVEETGADLYEIKIDRTYDDDMWTAWEDAQAEQELGEYPNITEPLPDLASYDTVLIGGPVWRRTISNPIFVYMNQADFTEKTVSRS